MFWYYFKTALRNILTNRKFSVINILGFAFAISICLAISLYVINEYSYDQYNKNTDQIVRLIETRHNSSQIDYRVKDILVRNFPEIQNGCLALRSGYPVEVECQEKGYYLDDIMSVDNNFFEVFTVSFVSRPESPVFAGINSAVITESTAKKLFGTKSPLGKDILVWGTVPVTVSAIIRDFPDNSSLSAGLLVNADNIRFKLSQWIGDSRDSSTYRWPFQIYLQLEKNVIQQQFSEKINDNISLLEPYIEQAGFVKLKDIYLHDPTTGSDTKKGNAGLLNLLTLIATIVLTLALINYVNLTVAQQVKHNKVTGIKKVFGAKRNNIVYQFLTESIIVIFIAFIFGITLLWFLMPFFQTLFNSNISISTLFRIPYFIILLAAVLAIGLISGTGPSIVLTRILPVKILTGSAFSPGKRNFLRNALIVFQFTISIILIFCVITVQRQIRYVKNNNPGFNEEKLLRLDLPFIRENDISKAMVLLDGLRELPYIESMSVTSGVPGSIRMSMGSNMENTSTNISVPCLLVDTAFIRTFGLKIIRGRDLGPGDLDKVCMINEAAYRHFEFDNLENKRFNNFGGFDIIGVVNDFHYSSLHKTIGPLCIMFTSKSQPSSINIRFAGNSIGPGMENIQKLWEDILPSYPFKYQFYDEWFDSMYRSEEYFARTISLFAVLAIIIASIGMLGLAIFSSERRTKEIGIRKINGAKVNEILLLLNREFISLVLIAYIIAMPVACYAMHKWLDSFAYRTDINWWIYLLAGLIALVIALATVSWQSWRAATKNPVEALRYE
ncbi:MAG: FtsX-like permease family protein [Bacteroidota bacterium]